MQLKHNKFDTAACMQHYGKSSTDDLRKGQLEAMGYKVVWEKKEFKF